MYSSSHWSQAATRPQYSKSEQRNESETYPCQYGLMKIIQEDSPHVKIKENSNQIHELQKPSNKPTLDVVWSEKNKVPSGNQSFRASLSYPSLGPESASNWFPHELKLYILHEVEYPLVTSDFPCDCQERKPAIQVTRDRRKGRY